MKRAILTTVGTVAGLVSVLAYSPPHGASTLAAGDAGAGLGGPAPATSGDPSTADPAGHAAGAAAGGRPIASSSVARARPARIRRAASTSRPPASSSAAPRTSAARSTSSTASSSTAPHPPAASTSGRPRRSTSRTTSPTSTPTPSNTATAGGPQDFTGAAVSYEFGTLQVAIRVQHGMITDAWAVTYPEGTSLPYSKMAIPILRSQTLHAQSVHIAGATGATSTSLSWKSSLAAALAEAGI